MGKARIKAVAVFLVAVFLVLECYYQAEVRFGRFLPSFVRIYNFQSYDSQGTPRLPPEIDAWHASYSGSGDIKIHINSKGFRGAEPLEQPSTRVIFLGDSVVFGGGVELRDTFPYLAQEMVRKQRHDPRFEVLNFGVGDTNARHYALKLKNHALDFKPQLVLIFLYLNDASEPMIGAPRRRDQVENRPWYHSFALEQLRSVLDNMHILYSAAGEPRFEWVHDFKAKAYLAGGSHWQKMLSEAQYDWGRAWTEDFWRVVRPHLASIREQCEVHSIDCWLAIVPVKPQLELPDTESGLFEPQRRAELLARELGFNFIDPLSYLRSAQNPASLLYDQCHLTPQGNAVMANFLVPLLEDWLNRRAQLSP